ncbi:MAG TPA: LacI family DNA-binding transcriptional regulator [Acidimicrobiia bacterium]
MASITDVAEAAGVGVGTVSRVLNDSPHVSEATRARVLAAIEHLHYRPNPAARALSSGRSAVISVVTGSLGDPATRERLVAAIEVLRRREYDVVIMEAETATEASRIIEDHASPQRSAGLLLIDVSLTPETTRQLSTFGVPTAIAGLVTEHLTSAGANGPDSVRLATKHVLDLGHTRIALAQRPEPPDWPRPPRRTGYLEAMAAAGLPPMVETINDPLDITQTAHLEALLRDPSAPTGVVATTDGIAYAVMGAAAVVGRQAPRDISIIGCGGVESSRLLGLTTVCESLAQSGAWAAEQVLAAIDGSDEGPKHFEADLRVVRRATTGPPPRVD